MVDMGMLPKSGIFEGFAYDRINGARNETSGLSQTKTLKVRRYAWWIDHPSSSGFATISAFPEPIIDHKRGCERALAA
jgi:hypothetical protein